VRSGPHPDRATGAWLKRLAGVVGVASVLTAALTGDSRGPAAIAGGLVAFTGLCAAFWLWDRGQRHLAPSAGDVVARDSRPPVLYLRSFESDRDVSAVEERLAHLLGEIGPFVALGRPGEKLPKLGAARDYVGEAEWRDWVVGMLGRAALVVMRAGRTAGLGWELAQCVRRLDPRRLVVLVPVDRGEYEAFRARAGRAGLRLPGHPAPVDAPVRAGEFCGLLRFTAGAEPRFVPFRKATFYGASHEIPSAETRFGARLQFALRDVVEPLGLPWRAPRLAGPFLAALLLLAAGGVGLAVLGWLR
jgi:hypothetical protein